jgi:hypothetical protein
MAASLLLTTWLTGKYRAEWIGWLPKCVVLFAIVMAYFAVPAPLQADNSDVPSMANREPELQQTVFDSFSINSDSL